MTWLKGTENKIGLSGDAENVAYRQIIDAPVFWQADSWEQIPYLHNIWKWRESYDVDDTKLLWGLTRFPAAAGYCVSPATDSSPMGASISRPWNSYITNMSFHVCLCSPIWMLITGGIVPLLWNTDIWLDLLITRRYMNIKTPSQLSASDWQFHLEFHILS